MIIILLYLIILVIIFLIDIKAEIWNSTWDCNSDN